MTEKKKFLVTGGAGFIGGNFVGKLLGEESGQVLVLDKLTYAGHLITLERWAENPDYQFVEGDIADSELVGRLLKEFKPDYLVNFAAESHVDRSIDSAADFVQTNIVGTHVLLEKSLEYWRSLGDSKGNFQFQHVSTDEVYGSLGATGYFQESTRYSPNSPYAASKAASDHLVMAYYRTYGLPATITNCSNNYGPYQFPEKLIPLALANALNGKPIPIYGDGQNIRDWIYVEDHCEAIMSVLAHGHGGETYNIGGNCERTNIELVGQIITVLQEFEQLPTDRPFEHFIEFVTDRPGHDQRYAIDASKIGRELGWQPRFTFQEAIRKTVRWYLDNQEWCTAVLNENYDGSRLGRAKND